jgi:RNA polymerase sigma factor (sigma-70 family)
MGMGKDYRKAEEMAHDTLTNAIFDGAGKFRPDGNFGAWLVWTAKACVKRHHGVTTWLELKADAPDSHAPTPDAQMQRSEIRDAWSDFVNRLAPVQKQIAKQVLEEGRPRVDVATSLGRTQGNVSTTIGKVRAKAARDGKLRELAEDEFGSGFLTRVDRPSE